MLSVALHGVLVVFVGAVALRGLRTERKAAPVSAVPSADTMAIAIDAPAVAEGSIEAEARVVPEGIAPRPSGGESLPRFDTNELGKGGDEHGPRATHLSDADEHASLTDDLADRLERGQEQRIRSGSERRSWEDRRQSRQPMELTFLATGTGTLDERRPRGEAPSRGAAESRAAEVRGGQIGGEGGGPGEGAPPGASREGTLRDSPGVGARNAKAGADHRETADPRTARPDVTEASPSIASVHRGRPSDVVDSRGEVEAIVRSLVHASVAGGSGDVGAGGAGGGGAPGAGGASGAGAHPRPLGSGGGDWLDLDTQDPRYLGYFRQIHAKIHPLWKDAFPKDDLYALRQGMVILSFTVHKDGSVEVAWPPLRPSGIDAFDRNCAEAIRKAAPLPPPPAALGSEVRIRAPFTGGASVSWEPASARRR